MSKPKLLTEFQERQKEFWTPKPPSGLTPTALRFFNQAVKKIKFNPLESGGLERDLSELTLEELFAIGESGTSAWPMFLPRKAKEIQYAMRQRGDLGIFPTRPGFTESLERVLNLERQTILTTVHGEKFGPGRDNLAVNDFTKHVRELVSEHPTLSAKALYSLANPEILGALTMRSFENSVSMARKHLSSPKPKKSG